MAGRKRHGTLSSAVEVGGCLWFVSSDFSDRHVIAPDVETAIATYLAIPAVAAARAKDASETDVVKVERIDGCVWALPIKLADVTGDGGGR